MKEIYVTVDKITSMNSLIISDIHDKFEIAEKIIQKENPNQVIFLGDYFDSIRGTAQDAVNTAKWLVKSLKIKNRIHMVGNHDLSYMTDNPKLKCSGYSQAKYDLINYESVPWTNLKLYHWLDDRWLCTHAGLSDSFVKQYRSKNSNSIQQVLDISKKDLEHIDDFGYGHAFFQVGTFRGGSSMVGGPLWCDYDEFVPVPGINQIFGHTRSSLVRHECANDSEHYCLDTGLDHYAIYQNGTMQIMRAVF